MSLFSEVFYKFGENYPNFTRRALFFGRHSRPKTTHAQAVDV